MAESSRERIARNEAAFRKINEGIRAGRDAEAGERLTFVCECAVLGCNELIEMSLEEYEAVRGSSRRLVIVEGHEVPDAKPVVWTSDAGAVVVEKDSDLLPITRALDPRRHPKVP